MSVRVNIDGQIVNVTDTDDPKLAKKIAQRELKKRSGDYSSLGETFIKGPIHGMQKPITHPMSLIFLKRIK